MPFWMNIKLVNYCLSYVGYMLVSCTPKTNGNHHTNYHEQRHQNKHVTCVSPKTSDLTTRCLGMAFLIFSPKNGSPWEDWGGPQWFTTEGRPAPADAMAEPKGLSNLVPSTATSTTRLGTGDLPDGAKLGNHQGCESDGLEVWKSQGVGEFG